MVGNDNYDNYENELSEKEIQIRKNKKLVQSGIIVCSALILVVILAIVYFIIEDKNTLKLYLDGGRVEITEGMIIDDKDGTRYISIKDISELVGYSYMTGKYEDYSNSDEKSFFVKNNKEAANFTIDSKELTKDIIYLTNSIELQESYELKSSIKQVNNKTYINIENLRELLNMYVSNSEKRINLYSLEYLETVYAEKVKDAGYKELSQEYKNKRAMAYGLLVVIGEDGKFGAVDLNMKSIIDLRYDNMEFIQKTMSFFVKVGDYIGLVTDKNEIEIPPDTYSQITVLDEKQRLYIVMKDQLYGVIKLNSTNEQETVVYVEYNEIGVDISDFKRSGEKNGKLLFNKLIPVKKDKKWGLFDVGGNQVLNTLYDNLGYIKNSSDGSNVNSILTIPKSVGFEGVVICKDNKYGIVTTSGKLIPCSNDKIFSKTEQGETKYYIRFNNVDTELNQEWARKNGLIENISEVSNNNSDGNTEMQNNIQNNISENIYVENSIDANVVNNTNTTDNNGSFLDNTILGNLINNSGNENTLSEADAKGKIEQKVRDILSEYYALRLSQNIVPELENIENAGDYVKMKIVQQGAIESCTIIEADGVFVAKLASTENILAEFTIDDEGNIKYLE